MGDIVHALPAVAALGETFPQAEIHWAVENRHAQLLEGNPYLHRLVKLDTLGWRERLTTRDAWREIRCAMQELRGSHYDAAVDFQGLWKSALIGWLSGAPERIGFEEHWLREPASSALYTQRVSPRGRQHIIDMNLALVERLGASTCHWQFPLPRTDADDALVEAQVAPFDAQGFIIVNPGGGWQSKCWSPENYAELVRRWGEKLREPVILTGSSNEDELISTILHGARNRRARFLPTSVVQFIALVRRARLFVGGDTGPLHLAAAVGTPIVGIFGPTDPARNGPFAKDDIALSNSGPIDHTRRESKPTYLTGISVDTVLAAIEARLARAYG
jgi:lipopolysaccharide heptosyltransferase I